MIEAGLLSKAAKTRGNKLSPILYADAMVERAKSDEVFMAALSGEPQVILTATLGGVEWRIMVDALNAKERVITDLKTSKSLTKKAWFDRDDIFSMMDGTAGLHSYKGLYFDQYAYYRQFAIYRAIAATAHENADSDWTLLMASISKEKPSDPNPRLEDNRLVQLELRLMDDERALNYEMEAVLNKLPQVMRWKNGEDIAPMCGKCAFCVAHAKVKGPVSTKSIVWE